MASGVKVADGVKELFSQMKVVKNDADQMERIRLVVLSICGEFIDVEKIYREKDLKDKDVFKVYMSELKPKTCRYILYDCHFETKESSKKEELVFVLWCPDESNIKEKMCYASSKDALKAILKSGVKHDLQINDLSDCGDRDSFGKKLGPTLIKVEGHPVTITP